MSRAQTHYRGRRLTGMTFGKRGGPAYARLYLKSGEADDDAFIRSAWERAGYDAATHGAVWRVELELRSELFRTMAQGGAHLPSDPAALLALHLDDLWAHQLTHWLVLRETASRSRIERCPPAVWWVALAGARGLNGAASAARGDLARQPRAAPDCTPLLRQAAGLLASVAAAKGRGGSLDEALGSFSQWMTDAVGPKDFAAAVRRAQERRADAALADGWFPLGETLAEGPHGWDYDPAPSPLNAPQVE